MVLKTKVINIHKQIMKMKQDLINEINICDQNPKIKVLSKNCYVINSKDLSNDLNLCPFYYNFKTQYEYISQVIENTRIESILSVLNSIIETGRHKKDTYHRVKFNPIVINKIKSLI